MRFTLFMIFFDVSMVVMAQQVPRTLSFVNAEISAICGDDPSPYIERIRLLHRISSNLALEQLECCRAFDVPRPVRRHRPASGGGGHPLVKNTWGFPQNPRPAVIVVHRLPILSTAKRSDRKMTGYNTASAPSPMSRTLTTTDAAGASYFLHDANKNVMQRTDAEGNLTEKYEYAPFGGNTGEARAGVGFSSEAFDAATDLSYYNYRYYAPGLGRWTKRDPIGERGGNKHIWLF